MVNTLSRATDIQHASGMAARQSLPRSRNTIDQTVATFKFGSWSRHTTFLKNSNSLDNLSHYSPSGLYVFSLAQTTGFQSLKYMSLVYMQTFCNVCDTHGNARTY